jgi:hypothetical protein
MVGDHSNASFSIQGSFTLGLSINSLNPDKVGADLVANAFATWQKTTKRHCDRPGDSHHDSACNSRWIVSGVAI